MYVCMFVCILKKGEVVKEREGGREGGRDEGRERREGEEGEMKGGRDEGSE